MEHTQKTPHTMTVMLHVLLKISPQQLLAEMPCSAPATAELHGNTKLVDVVLCCVAWDTIHHEHGREVGASRILMEWGKRVWEDQPSMMAGGLAPDSITGYFCSNLKK